MEKLGRRRLQSGATNLKDDRDKAMLHTQTNALHERLSVREKPLRGEAIAMMVTDNQSAAENRAAAFIAAKQASAAARNEKIHESVQKVHEAGRAALKEKRANLDSNMRVHATNREAHVDIVKTKGANELNKVANAIAKRLDGWEDKYEQLEETLEDAAISRAQHLEAKVQKAKEVSKKVSKAEMRFKCETEAKAAKLAEISAAVAAKRREALDRSWPRVLVGQKVEAAAAKLQAEAEAKARAEEPRRREARGGPPRGHAQGGPRVDQAEEAQRVVLATAGVAGAGG